VLEKTAPCAQFAGNFDVSPIERIFTMASELSIADIFYMSSTAVAPAAGIEYVKSKDVLSQRHGILIIFPVDNL